MVSVQSITAQAHPVYSWRSVVLFVPQFVLASLLSRLSLFATFSEMSWKCVLKESFGTPRYFGLLSFCMESPCNCRWIVVLVCTGLNVNILYTVLDVFIFSFQSSQRMESMVRALLSCLCIYRKYFPDVQRTRSFANNAVCTSMLSAR